jgi:F-type H+-transporting ATPase subunit alpha
MTLAEYYMESGRDVLIVFDDLTDHAKYYREVSLIGRKFPSRSAYPADIFYTHSRLLERAGCFKTKNGIGTITCLPVAETVEGDISGYIQTNLMSITDGHLFFDTDLFLQGIRPPINYFLSVTRVGRQTQTKLKWSLGREIANFLEILRRTQGFVHFGAEINQGIKSTLATGEKLTKVFFNQLPGQVLETNLQLLLFSLIWSQVLKAPDNQELAKECQKVITKYHSDANYQTLVKEMVESCTDFNKLLGLVSSKQSDLL